MGSGEALLGALLRMSGGTEQQLVDIRQAVINRMRDARAFALGGALSTGEKIPGMVAELHATAALRDQVRELLQVLNEVPELRKLRAQMSSQLTAQSAQMSAQMSSQMSSQLTAQSAQIPPAQPAQVPGGVEHP